MNTAIGLDEAGINDDRDMLQELKLVLRAHRVPGMVEADVPTMSQVLRMATVGGARTTPYGTSLGTLTTANRGAFAVSLPAYGYRVLAARVAPPVPPQPTPYNGLDIPTDFAPATRVAVQATPTSLGDNVNELDALYARPDSAGLSLGITGNLATDGSAIALFLDTAPGGQDSLATSTLPQPPSGLPQANGLGFDVGFAPDEIGRASCRERV